MSFQTDGRVFACCRKPAVCLGDTTAQTLREIWDSERGRSLRRTMAEGAFDPTCAHCERLVGSGVGQAADLQKYAHFGVTELLPAWPRRLEFNLTNTCNLECIHCSGELSSRIRSRREQRPPLPRVYGDRFFAELEEFLPHLESAVFLGGEPFLQRECRRIWSMLLEGGHQPQCLIVTNGTVLDDFAERVLRELPCRLTVSLDGATRETVESVRVGASFDAIVANLGRFRELTRQPGSELLMALCAMRNNWHELGRFCLWADELEAQVRINPLSDPEELSLLSLDADSLREIVAKLEEEAREVEPRLGLNRGVYRQWLDSLRRHVEGGAGVSLREGLARSRRRLEGQAVQDAWSRDPAPMLARGLSTMLGGAFDQEAAHAVLVGRELCASPGAEALLRLESSHYTESGFLEFGADLSLDVLGDAGLAAVLQAGLRSAADSGRGWRVHRVAAQLVRRSALQSAEAAMRWLHAHAQDGSQVMAAIWGAEQLADPDPETALRLLSDVARCGEIAEAGWRRFHVVQGGLALQLEDVDAAADAHSGLSRLGLRNEFQQSLHRRLGEFLASEGRFGRSG